MSLYAKPSPSPRHECSQPRRCPALGDTRGFSSSSKQHEERMFLRVQTINKPKGGVGGPAGPSTSDRTSATCAAISARFRQKSFPYTNERPGERLAVRPVSECISSTKCLWHFVDTLHPGGKLPGLHSGQAKGLPSRLEEQPFAFPAQRLTQSGSAPASAETAPRTPPRRSSCPWPAWPPRSWPCSC